MNRRDFIGGCAAGAVAAGLPAVQASAPRYTEYSGLETLATDRTFTITVSGGAAFWCSCRDDENLAMTVSPDGTRAFIECERITILGNGVFQIHNPSRIVGQP
jgi:hypothetical protein